MNEPTVCDVGGARRVVVLEQSVCVCVCVCVLGLRVCVCVGGFTE